MDPLKALLRDITLRAESHDTLPYLDSDTPICDPFNPNEFQRLSDCHIS